MVFRWAHICGEEGNRSGEEETFLSWHIRDEAYVMMCQCVVPDFCQRILTLPTSNHTPAIQRTAYNDERKFVAATSLR